MTEEQITTTSQEADAPEDTPESKKKKRGVLIGLIICLAGIHIIAKLIGSMSLETSSLMFIGVPALLAFGLVFVDVKNPGPVIFKGITLALLLSSVLLGEGAICILMAAPLFYLAGLIMWLNVRKAGEKDKRRVMVVVTIPLLLMSVEGIHQTVSFPRDNVVEASQVMEATAKQIKRHLYSPVTIRKQDIPMVMHLFPMPLKSKVSCRRVGCTIHVTFSKGRGDKQLVFKIIEIAADGMRFEVVRDNSKVAHWLAWKRFYVRWDSLGSGKKRVYWRVSFDRRLDPYWYFTPIERIFAKVMVRTLLGHLQQDLKQQSAK